MKNNKQYPEIKFDKQKDIGAHFDIVSFQELLSKNPPDHSQFEFHKVSFYVVLLFTKGSGNYNLNFKEYTYKKGTVFTINKNNIHKFQKSKADGMLLVFTKEFIFKHSNKMEATNAFVLFNEMLSSPKIQLSDDDFDAISSVVTHLRRERNYINDKFSADIQTNLLQALLSQLLRIKSLNNPSLFEHKYLYDLLQFQHYIEKFCFQNRQVIFYAEKMNISGKTLNKVTQTIVQTSAKAFINSIFIIHIKRLIVNSNDPLTQIAYQIGFDEPTNFFKFFRKHCGISAKEFRNMVISKK